MKALFLLLASALALFSAPAFAVIDVTLATGGVLDAQVAMLAVIGALMVLTTTLFGITMVLGFLKRKTGA